MKQTDFDSHIVEGGARVGNGSLPEVGVPANCEQGVNSLLSNYKNRRGLFPLRFVYLFILRAFHDKGFSPLAFLGRSLTDKV